MFMTTKILLCGVIGFSLFAQISRSQDLQLQPLATFGTNGNGWVAPGNTPYLTDGSTNSYAGSSGVHELQRSMAYNPTTGHLLVLSRTNVMTGDSYGIGIIDANTGANVGWISISPNNLGTGGNTGFGVNAIAVAADGGIYVCDLTSQSQADSDFNLYYWSSETGSQTYIWQGDPSAGNNTGGTGNSRWGDSIAVTGTGTNTQVLVSSRGNVVAILTPTGPSLTQPWGCTTILTTVPTANIGYALAYGAASNTFYAQAEGSPLYLFSYTWTNNSTSAGPSTMGGVATNIQTYATTNFPQWTGAVGEGLNSQSNLLVELEMPSGLAANVRLYGITNTAVAPVLLDRLAWATNETGDGIFAGSILFGGTNVYALTSDNGVMAFSVTNGPQPSVPAAIILDPANTTAFFQNSASFTGAADGIPAPAYQWYFVANNVTGTVFNAQSGRTTATTLTVTNIATTNLGNYFFITTNLYGSATSSVANLSQAVAFQNGVLYEPFNYPAGLNLPGLGGWVINAASTSPTGYIAAGSLSAFGLAPSIGNHYFWSNNVTIRLPFGTESNGPLYFSFILQPTNPPNNFSEDAIGGTAYYSSTQLYPKIGLYWQNSSQYQIGIAKGSVSGYPHIYTNATVFSATQPVFMVGMLFITNVSGFPNADSVNAWFNPNPTNYGAAVAPPPDIANLGSSIAIGPYGIITGDTDPGSGGINGVDRWSWRGDSALRQHQVDEMRIGFTWASVTAPLPVYLTASATNNNAVVSWPTNSVGYTLISNTNLESSGWVTNTPITVQGTNNTFTEPISTGAQFFRLTR